MREPKRKPYFINPKPNKISEHSIVEFRGAELVASIIRRCDLLDRFRQLEAGYSCNGWQGQP